MKKEKTQIEKIINWSVISEQLTKKGGTTNIRYDRVPDIHKERIEQLKYYIDCWIKKIDLEQVPKVEKDIFNFVEQEFKEIRNKFQYFR